VSTPSPIITAAEPVAIAVLKALQTFIANLGTDPAQVAVKFPGAAQVFLGTVEMQLPALASSEFSALQADVNSKINGWISKLTPAA
jgi:hypothetical protein